MRMYTPVAAWKQVKKLELVALENGPLLLSPSSLKDVYMIAWMATNAEAHPALRFCPAPEVDFSEVEATAKESDGELIVGHDESGARWQSIKDISDVASLLDSLAEGTEMELFTAADSSGGQHRYSGVIKEGGWQLERTYPAASKEDLEKALHLAKSDPIEFATEQLAERAEELAEEEFAGTDLRVVREGASLRGQMRDEPDDSVTDMIRPYAFRVIFEDGPWPLLVGDDDDDDGLLELSHQLSNMFTQPDPQGKKVVFAGEFGRYFPDVLTSQAHVTEEDIKLLDQEMDALGFQALGGLSCNKIPGTSMRAYAGGEGAYAVGTASQFGMFVVEFYTAFEDGSSVTTTTNPYVESSKKKKIFRKSFSNLEPEQLLGEHRRAVKGRGQPAVPVEPTLEGLAKAIDEYLVRQGGLFI